MRWLLVQNHTQRLESTSCESKYVVMTGCDCVRLYYCSSIQPSSGTNDDTLNSFISANNVLFGCHYEDRAYYIQKGNWVDFVHLISQYIYRRRRLANTLWWEFILEYFSNLWFMLVKQQTFWMRSRLSAFSKLTDRLPAVYKRRISPQDNLALKTLHFTLTSTQAIFI